MFSAKYCILNIFIILFISINAKEIEQVDDTDLIHLLTGEDNVIALFTKSNCPECDELEIIISNIQNDLKETLKATIVKAHHSQLVHIYDPSREPSLVFFRKGIPLLYYGEMKEEEIFHTFNENREPVVKELADFNFEHLTQASTGATTGDWFVFFYSADCIPCQRLYGVWEAVGSKLRQHLNVARINRFDQGAATAKRFGITESPVFLLLRQGKVYRYKSKEYTPKAFIEFIETGYRKQTQPESVPELPGLLDNFIENRLRSLLENTQIVMPATIVAISLALIYLIYKFLTKKKNTAATTKKEKQTKKSK